MQERRYTNKEKAIIHELRQMFTNDWQTREDRELKIKACELPIISDFIVDVYRRGIKQGKDQKLKEIKKLINE